AASCYAYSTNAEKSVHSGAQQGVNGWVSGASSKADLKDEILKAALDFVPLHGWTWKSIAAGANSLGLSTVAHGLFPGGNLDLITFYYLTCNDALESQLSSDTEKSGPRGASKDKVAFIQDAVWKRLLLMASHKDTWAQALGILALPQNIPVAVSNLRDLLDIIWHKAGDGSIDMSWYSKRLALAALYQSTELVFVQDKSADFSQTSEFLERRSKDFAAFNSCSQKISQARNAASDVAELGFATLKNVLRMNTW
ncbi:unnamed protein product, partial [Ixodes hexagonus]